MAFTAERWGDAAVVCRAMEHQAGPVMDQQFGLFETWTHAQVFALRLNEGLDIDPREARQIVTSSVLAMACVLDEAASLHPRVNGAFGLAGSGAMQTQFLIAELNLALTFCRLIQMKPEVPAARMLENDCDAMSDILQFGFRWQPSDGELEEIVTRLEMLKMALQSDSLAAPDLEP